MNELFVVKQVQAGLIQEPRLKQLDGKWGFFAVNGSQVYPLSVFPEKGEPTKEWIEDCRDYYFGDNDDESKWVQFREEEKAKSVPWLATHHYDDETLANSKWQFE